MMTETFSIKQQVGMVFALVTLTWLGTSCFVLDARELGVVTMFGDPVRPLQEPGLRLKLPWPVQQVERFDARAQLLEVETLEAFTKDTKNLVIVPFVVWKIQDPIVFMERIRTLKDAQRPIEDLVTSTIASAVGQLSFTDVLNTENKRDSLLPDTLVSDVNTEAKRLGIVVESIAIEKLSLPVQNEQSIYERMRAERSRIANRYRSEGEEQASAIRAKADREAVEIRIGAEKEAANLVAAAEKRAHELYQAAYAKDPSLYTLIRDLESVEASLENGGTLILSGEERPFSTLLKDQ
jgi:membrane protease subunit HflC